MLTSIFSAIGSGLKAVAAFFGWQGQREAEKNSPEMQANARARTDAAAADQAVADVKAGTKGNLDQLRKDAAE